MNKNYFYETSWCKKCSSEWFKKYTQTPNGRRLKAKHRKLWKQTPAGKISTKKTKTKYSLSKQNKIIS